VRGIEPLFLCPTSFGKHKAYWFPPPRTSMNPPIIMAIPIMIIEMLERLRPPDTVVLIWVCEALSPASVVARTMGAALLIEPRTPGET